MRRQETFPPVPGLLVHHESDCDALKRGSGVVHCVIHAPSKHCMNDWPYNWRSDRGLMERICEHGIGHPDPDDLEFKRRTVGDKRADIEAVHGCDGCCAGGYRVTRDSRKPIKMSSK